MPETKTSSSLGGSCITSPGVSRGRAVSWREYDAVRMEEPGPVNLGFRRPPCRAVGRDGLGFPRPPHRHADRKADRCEAAGGCDCGPLDEYAWCVGVEVVPPPEEGRRQVDRRICNLEPGRAKLRLEAESPRRPLSGAPHRRQHDRKDGDDLAPKDLGGGQVGPRCNWRGRLKRSRAVPKQPGN